MTRWLTAMAMVFAVAAVSSPGDAWADRKVFLNGVDLEGVAVPARAFDRAKVRFDADGNVHIAIPGFEVEARPAGEKAAREKAALERRYFVAFEGTEPGRVQYRVVVYVNGKAVKTIRPGEADGVVEVTRFARRGDNRLAIVATKDLGTAKRRRSASPKDRVGIVLGEGTLVDGAVKLRRAILRYSRNASETKDFSHTFAFDAR